MGLKHSEVTDKIIGAFYTVFNTLGHGFSEKVYHAAMILELRALGLTVVSEQPISVYYRGQVTADFYADLVVNDCVIVELMAVKELVEEHEAQLLNYLRATRYEVGLLLNFGPEPKFLRRAYDNSRKGTMSWIN